MIPEKGWCDMADAPQDGTPIMVRFCEWGNPAGKLQVQPAMWLCDRDGQCWTWREPYRMGTTVHAEAWMHIDEFEKQQRNEGFVNSPIKNKASVADKPKSAPTLEFDL